MNWIHPICDKCWVKINADRIPVRIELNEIVTCCFCGSKTFSGIWIRYDPRKIHCCCKE